MMEVPFKETTAALTANNSKELYRCDKCPKIYSIVMRFKRHKDNHNKEGGSDLTEGSNPRKGLNNERKALPIKSKSKKLKLEITCKFCQQIFHERKAHRRHEGRHAESRTENCTFCTKTFADNRSLRDHQRIHNRQFNCLFCAKTFSNISNLNIHKRTHTGEKPFLCKICQKSFAAKEYFKRHSLEHLETPKQQLKCAICSYESVHKAALYTHNKRVHHSVVYQCKECGQNYASKTSLKNHTEVKHKGRQLSCPFCEYKTAYSASLNDHQKGIHEAVRVSCSVCNWEGKPRQLPSHKRKFHLKIQRLDNTLHQCEVCKKSFPLKHSLKSHTEKVHMGIRYQCIQCGQRTSTVRNLKIHQMSKHEGIKIPCPQCNHKAYDRSSLSKHINAIHLRLRPHKCQSCKYQTATISNLKYHEERYHISC